MVDLHDEGFLTVWWLGGCSVDDSVLLWDAFPLPNTQVGSQHQDLPRWLHSSHQSWLIWEGWDLTQAEAVTLLELWVRLVNGDTGDDQFSSVTQSGPTLCEPMDCSMPGLPVHHQLLEFTQTYVHWVGDAIQPSHPLSSPSPPTFNLSQHQGLFKWVSSSQQMAKVLEFQLQFQHQSFQWIFRTDFF